MLWHERNHERSLAHCFWLLFCICALFSLCNSQFLERRFVQGAGLILWRQNTFLSLSLLYNNPLSRTGLTFFDIKIIGLCLICFDIFFALKSLSYSHMARRANKPISIFIVIKFILPLPVSLRYYGI